MGKRINVIRLFLTFTLLAYAASTVAAEEQLTLSESELEALIDKRIDARLKALGIAGESIDDTIEQGIRAFIARQRAANDPSRKAKNVKPVSVQTDHIYGNPQAPISLIEYSDFECPYCKQFHPTARRIVDDYGGRVNWVYRHFPLAFHNPGAQKQAEASECAAELGGNDAFWRYADRIFERTKSNGKGFPLENLVPLAAEIDLDDVAFRRCLDSGRHEQRVRQDFVEGTQAGVTGTPGNILRDNRTGQVIAIAGALPYERVRSNIERLLSDTARN